MDDVSRTRAIGRGRAGVRLAPMLRPLVLLLGLVAAGLAIRLLPAGGAAGLVAPLAGRGGAEGAVGLVLAGATLCALGVPRQVVCYAAGAAFGGAAGTLAALIAQMLGCGADFCWSRLLARGWVAARLRGRLARVDRALTARPFVATLTLRLLPVGNNLLLTLAAGVSGVSAWRFLLASAFGYLPQTVVFALAGSGVRLGEPARIGLALGLFAASGALGLLLWRREAGLSASSGGDARPPG